MFAALVFVAAAAAATLIPAPDDWRKESFPFPLQFAPGIPYQGMEYLRFHPGWDQFADETGFSYVVLWDVRRCPWATGSRTISRRTSTASCPTSRAGASSANRPRARCEHIRWRRCDWQRGSACRSAPTTRSRRASRSFSTGNTQRKCGERMQIFFALSGIARDKPITELASQSQGTACQSAA